MPAISYFTNTFSRQGATKHLSYGSLQSVVAVTHPSSYPNQHRNRLIHNPVVIVKPAYPFKNAFHSSVAASEAVAAVKDVHDVLRERITTDQNGLDAYFEAWERTQECTVVDVNEQAEQPFGQKRIEWKSPVPAAVEPRVVDRIALPGVSRAIFDRSWSTSAIEVLKAAEDSTKIIGLSPSQPQHVELALSEKAALAEIDAKLERELNIRAALDELDERVPTPSNVHTQSPALSTRSYAGDLSRTPALSVSPVSEAQAHKFASHMTQLANEGRYAEIPAVFQAMLVGDIIPTVQAYTALLSSIVNISGDLQKSVPKALNLYSDMLRRRISPNTEIYGMLIALIASRSLEISSLKKALEVRRARYGGMEEAGSFMFPSTELDHKILSEDDRLSIALDLFKKVTSHTTQALSVHVYNSLVTACAAAARVTEMTRLLEHMEENNIRPSSSTISAVILSLTRDAKDLCGAIDCYNDYKELAIAHNAGMVSIEHRNDVMVYVAVVQSYVLSNKIPGAIKFIEKVVAITTNHAVNDALIADGLVHGLLEIRSYSEALAWASRLQDPETRTSAFAKIAISSADENCLDIAALAFSNLPLGYAPIVPPTKAMLAMSVRNGDVNAATYYWTILSQSVVDPTFIEVTTIYAIALIGSGQVVEGLDEANRMFTRVLSTVNQIESHAEISLQIDEATHKIQQFMNGHNISDPRSSLTIAHADHVATITRQEHLESFRDPFAETLDSKGSAQIIGELEKGAIGRFKESRLNKALARLRGIRSLNRHPRYVAYAKLISAAASDQRFDLINDIYALAQTDMPLEANLQYPIVRQGWSSILDAMVGACLNIGKRGLADQYHQKLLDIGFAPTANTFGIYITTLKESMKTSDEATEAVSIFQRARSEGVEPSSFLFNALIGKLGKARRIDDCLQYFNEMRALGIQPTSVTYGTLVNALCRVSNSQLAEVLFNEMEVMPNYKARTAPYNSMMQFFLITKHDKSKVMEYYERMQSRGIPASSHTYKLLIDAHAALEPIDIREAESVLDLMRNKGYEPETVHYSSLIHAYGCVLHDLPAARSVFDAVTNNVAIRPSACLYQAMFESMVANRAVNDTLPLLVHMQRMEVDMTPYIANTLIKGWAIEGNLAKAVEIYEDLGVHKREPSTYEAMVRAYLGVGKHDQARSILKEMDTHQYPAAVANKVIELLAG